MRPSPTAPAPVRRRCSAVLDDVAARRERTPDERQVEPRRGTRDRHASGRSPSISGVAANSIRVYGCCGSPTSLCRRPELGHLPGVHHRGAVAQPGDQRQVVGDQHARPGPSCVGQPGQQVQHLGLDDHVQRGGRLVGEQQLGLAGQRHRDRRPLPLPAGQLVRVAVVARPTGMPTSSSSSRARALAARPGGCRGTPSARRSASPTRCTGLKAFIAPWNTIATSRQRCGRDDSSPAPAGRRRPARPGRTARRSAAAAPSGRAAPWSCRSPDSPTRPIRSPARRVERDVPDGVRLAVRARRTRRSGRSRSSSGDGLGSVTRQVTPASAAPGTGGRTGGRPAAAG